MWLLVPRTSVVKPHQIERLTDEQLALARLELGRLFARPDHHVFCGPFCAAAVLVPLEIRRRWIRCGLVRYPHADPLSRATVRQIRLDFCLNGFRLPLARDKPAQHPDLGHYSSKLSEKTALNVDDTTTDNKHMPLPVPACDRRNFV